MGTVWNIRGTNGSGKSTLARGLLPAGALKLNLLNVPDPTKTDPHRLKPVYGHVGTLGATRVGHAGPYDKATGGLDAISKFAYQQDVCRILLGVKEGVCALGSVTCEHVVAEGLLAAHVYGSWAALDLELEQAGHRFAWAYLGTSLEECHRRVVERQEAAGRVRNINWPLVDSQYHQIIKTRNFALRDGRLVYDLPEGDKGTVLEAMLSIMRGRGEEHRAVEPMASTKPPKGAGSGRTVPPVPQGSTPAVPAAGAVRAAPEKGTPWPTMLMDKTHLKRVVVNIRGANASGKSTLARLFHEPAGQFELGAWPDKNGKQVAVSAYRTTVPGLELPVYLLGTYDHRKYSGMDTIDSADVTEEVVNTAARYLDGHVIFEGFRMSKTWGRFATLRNRVVRDAGVDWVWWMLNASLELVIQRTEERRDAASTPTDRERLRLIVAEMNSYRIKAKALFHADTFTPDPGKLSPKELRDMLVAEMVRRERRG